MSRCTPSQVLKLLNDLSPNDPQPSYDQCLKSRIHNVQESRLFDHRGDSDSSDFAPGEAHLAEFDPGEVGHVRFRFVELPRAELPLAEGDSADRYSVDHCSIARRGVSYCSIDGSMVFATVLEILQGLPFVARESYSIPQGQYECPKGKGEPPSLEKAFMYCLMLITIAVLDSGAFSLDATIFRR